MGIWGYGAAIQLGSERRATVSVFIWCLIGFSIIHYYWLQFTWRPAQNSSYPVALIAFHQRMEWIWIWGCLSHQFSNSSNSNCIIKRNFWFWFSPPPSNSTVFEPFHLHAIGFCLCELDSVFPLCECVSMRCSSEIFLQGCGFVCYIQGHRRVHWSIKRKSKQIKAWKIPKNLSAAPQKRLTAHVNNTLLKYSTHRHFKK